MENLKDLFLLRKDIAFLNFGSFGACPKPVFERYQAFQRELEEEPVQFFMDTGPHYLREARTGLGKYVNGDPDSLVYVANPSYAVNIVAKSLRLQPGDEILTTDLEYGACDRTWSFCAKRTGAVIKRQKITLPLTTAQTMVDELLGGVTEKTKMIFVSHITSTTAVILPVKMISKKARELGVPCFIDGAHAPGQIETDLSDLDADFYTGACHKWMMAPKGSAFLYAKQEVQAQLDPLVVSWGYESTQPSYSRYLDYHEGQGTRDYSAFLSVPAAIRFMNERRWAEVAARCRKMVIENAPRFMELLRTSPLTPLTEEFIAQMLSLEVTCAQPEKVQQKLFRNYKIEIPLMRHGEKVFLRFSINGFNSKEDLDRLFDAVSHLVRSGDLVV